MMRKCMYLSQFVELGDFTVARIELGAITIRGIHECTSRTGFRRR